MISHSMSKTETCHSKILLLVKNSLQIVEGSQYLVVEVIKL